jgi:hypothetical protein
MMASLCFFTALEIGDESEQFHGEIGLCFNAVFIIMAKQRFRRSLTVTLCRSLKAQIDSSGQ